MEVVHKNMKIAIYGICKNEIKFAKRFAESIAGKADYVIYCDTGSTDGTQEVLRSYGYVVHDIKVEPFRFDTARNISIQKLPDDVEVGISMDLDDILLPNWRDTIEKNWVEGKTKLLYHRYINVWEDDEQKIPKNSMYGYKIHNPKYFFWQYPVHELPEVKDKSTFTAENVGVTEEQILVHYPDHNKQERFSRLDIFKRITKEEFKKHKRLHCLYGKELCFNKKFDEAEVELKKYLNSTYPYNLDPVEYKPGEENKMFARYQCCYLLAQIAVNAKRNITDSISWHLRGVSESPYQREPWMNLAFAWYIAGNGAAAYAAAKRGMEITNKVNSLDMEMQCWDERADKLLEESKKLMIEQFVDYENNIEGWTTKTELSILCNTARVMDSVAEIGCWKGRSTYALLSSCKGMVYAIDHFKGTKSDGDAHKEAFENSNKVFKQFKKNTRKFKNLKILKMSSEEAVAKFQNYSIDMVFIDGDHSYEEVKKDLRMWFPKAKKIICGHDYNFPEVKKAVDEFFGEKNIGIYENIWSFMVP